MEQFKSVDYPLHDHPLVYIEHEQEPSCCSACGLPLSSTPYYKCTQDCNFFLHEACRQLPQELNYFSSKGLPCSLVLVAKPPYNQENLTCDKCGQSCKNSITYRSIDPNHEETIYVDALCAFPLEIKHDSHKHELVSIRRKAELLCDACGREHKGFFFSCKEFWCDFWIHKDCAELPRVAESTSHPHYLSLSYVLFEDLSVEEMVHIKCFICHEKFSSKAAYFCLQCYGIAHLNCVSSRIKKEPGDQPVQFPLEEADRSLFIYTMLDKRRMKKNEEDEKLSIDKYHNHPLIFHDNIIIDDKDYSISLSSKNYSSCYCNACIQPINSPPFYSCQEPECNFLLHKKCTNLPSEINLRVLSSTKKPSALKLKNANEFFSIFTCRVCGQRGNGFSYEYEVPDSIFSRMKTAHVECASLPRILRHQLHYRQHILYFMFQPLVTTNNYYFPCCPDDDQTHFVYKCASCKFFIHIKCALLPTKITHKFDKHPLRLSNGRTTNVNGKQYCVCEDYVDKKFWFYLCMECDQFFHIKCIPSVGDLSKIKFGGTSIIPCHPSDHPVTLTRMLNLGNQMCGECNKIIRGFIDDMAFQCSKCCYWVHFECALQSRH